MKNKRLGQYNEEEMAKKEEEVAARDAKEEAAANAIAVGSRCQVQVPGQPTKIGTVMYVGKCSIIIQIMAIWLQVNIMTFIFVTLIEINEDYDLQLFYCLHWTRSL